MKGRSGRKRWVSKPDSPEQDGGTEEQDGGTEADLEQFVSMATVREFLKEQESMLKSLFESSVKSLSTRVDDLVKSMESFESNLDFTQKQVDEISPLHMELDKAQKEVQRLDAALSSQLLSMEYLENQSHRNNIRVNGIAESSTRESWDEAEAKVQKAVKAKLGIDLDIERAHRVERKVKPGQPPSTKSRTIICKLRDWKQREEVLRKARKEKPTGIYIMEDLASATLKKREPQVPKLLAAKEAGKIAYFILDRLVIRDKPADKSAPAVDS